MNNPEKIDLATKVEQVIAVLEELRKGLLKPA